MSAGKTGSEIEVFVSPTFRKQLKKLSDLMQDKVDDEIEVIIDDPEIGEQKKGSLSHLRVHKFKVNSQEYLLGYNWQEQRLELFLLQLGSHENYYRDANKRAKQDLRFIDE